MREKIELSNIMISKNFKVIFFLTFTVFGCATIPKYKDADLIAIGNITNIEGVYENVPSNVEYRTYKTFDNAINWRKSKNDTIKFTSVKVKVLGDKLIQFTFLNTRNETKIINSKYKLNRNGFVTLKNRNFKLTGLPYIFGGYQINKIELGLTNQNQLILNGTKIDEGAILIIMPATIPKTAFIYKFERKDTNR